MPIWVILISKTYLTLWPGNLYRRGRLSTVELHFEVTCCVKKENVVTFKSTWSGLVSTRKSTVQSLPLQKGFSAFFILKIGNQSKKINIFGPELSFWQFKETITYIRILCITDLYTTGKSALLSWLTEKTIYHKRGQHAEQYLSFSGPFTKDQEPHSQNFIFFVTYESAQ